MALVDTDARPTLTASLGFPEHVAGQNFEAGDETNTPGSDTSKSSTAETSEASLSQAADSQAVTDKALPLRIAVEDTRNQTVDVPVPPPTTTQPTWALDIYRDQVLDGDCQWGELLTQAGPPATIETIETADDLDVIINGTPVGYEQGDLEANPMLIPGHPNLVVFLRMGWAGHEVELVAYNGESLCTAATFGGLASAGLEEFDAVTMTDEQTVTAVRTDTGATFEVNLATRKLTNLSGDIERSDSPSA